MTATRISARELPRLSDDELLVAYQEDRDPDVREELVNGSSRSHASSRSVTSIAASRSTTSCRSRAWDS